MIVVFVGRRTGHVVAISVIVVELPRKYESSIRRTRLVIRTKFKL